MSVSTDALLRPRRRRRWPWLVAVLVLLGGLVFAADVLTRQLAEQVLRTQVAQVLKLSSSADVQVSLGGGPVLLQVITGRIDRVDVTAGRVVVGKLTGTLSGTATGVPLDANRTLDTLRISFDVAAADLTGLAANLSGLPNTAITLAGSDLVATGSVSVLGAPVTVGVSLTPGVDRGAVTFTPSGAVVAGATVSADQLRANPLTKAIADPLLAQRSYCVASTLPKVLTLSQVVVQGQILHVGLTGDGATLGAAASRATGSCPGA